MPSNRCPFPRLVLAVTVLAAGIVDGILGEVFPLVFRPLGIASGRLLVDAILTGVTTLTPPIFVFVACRYAAITRLRTGTIAGVALTAGIVGRYAGNVIVSVLGGQGIPSPLVLATPSDLSVGLDSPIILFTVVLGVIAAGFWPLVGAFGGIGLTYLENGPT